MSSGTAAGGMRMSDYFRLVRRHWLVVLLCVLVGVGLAVTYLKGAPREYQATTSVLVTPTNPDAPVTADKTSGINLDTEAQLVTSTEAVAEAAKTLKVAAADIPGLADQVGVTVPPNTEILDITFTADSAKGAVDGSLAFAKAYLDQRQAAATAVINTEKKGYEDRIKAVTDSLNSVLKAGEKLPAGSADKARNDSQAAQLNGQLASLNSQLLKANTETVTPGSISTQPRLPSSPSSPNPLVALAAGVLLGLAAGVGFAALRHRSDDVIRTPEDLFQRTRVPVAAVLSDRLHEGEVSVLQPLTADGRSYARLRNLVTTSLEGSSRRVVLVAGVRRGSGPVAANLAASLARAGEEVVLVCADVFGGTAAALLAEAPAEGLAEVLAGEKEIDAVARRLPGIPTLRVLGAGHDVDRADALLQTKSLRTLLDRLADTASYVIIEAPATTGSPDAQTLAGGAELAVLVVESGPSTAREVLDACAQFEAVGTPVLGAVLGRYDKDSEPTRGTAADASSETDASEVSEGAGGPATPPPANGHHAAKNGAPGIPHANGADPAPTPLPPGARDSAPR